MPATTLSIISFSLITLAILSLWVTTQKISWGLFLVSMMIAYFNDNVTFQGIVYLSILGIALSVYYSLSYEKLAKPILGFAIALLGFLLINHYLPGFQKWRVLPKVALGPTSKAYTLYFYFDRPAMAFLFLSLALPLICSFTDWMKTIRLAAFYAAVLALLIIGPALFAHFVTFDPKFPSTTPIWILRNLLFISAPEECFFRGFIQKQTAMFFRYSKNGHWIAILLGTVMYSLQDLRGGSWFMFSMSLVMGGVYGYLYHKTDRIEAPIIARFLISMAHLFLFSYPALVGI